MGDDIDSMTKVNRRSGKAPLTYGSLTGSGASCGKYLKNKQVDGNTCCCGLNAMLLKSNSQNGGLII